MMTDRMADRSLREALERRLGSLPVLTHENGYPVQALPKSELLDLLKQHAGSGCERCGGSGWLDCTTEPGSGCKMEGHGGPCQCAAAAKYLPPTEQVSSGEPAETHYGLDQSGTFETTHKGRMEHCPAPECEPAGLIVTDQAVEAAAAVLRDWYDMQTSGPAVARELLEAAVPFLQGSANPHQDLAIDPDAIEGVLEEHFVECTGQGEVTCGGCRDRGWMSWRMYRTHLRDLIIAAVRGGVS